jgi:hypothetical protein
MINLNEFLVSATALEFFSASAVTKIISANFDELRICDLSLAPNYATEV